MDSPQVSTDTVHEPTADCVLAAGNKFERENALTERALTELFGQFPRNDNNAHILLKVVAVNSLYYTQILAVHDVARHIYEHGKDIDSALSAGSPEIVDTIAAVTIAATGKERRNYSFASKYCSWPKPELYPIWDSRVRAYLIWLRQRPSGSFLVKNPDNWEHYREFLEMVTKLREVYGLGAGLGFKQIDKFLYAEGEKVMAQKDRFRASQKDDTPATQV